MFKLSLLSAGAICGGMLLGNFTAMAADSPRTGPYVSGGTTFLSCGQASQRAIGFKFKENSADGGYVSGIRLVCQSAGMQTRNNPNGTRTYMPVWLTGAPDFRSSTATAGSPAQGVDREVLCSRNKWITSATAYTSGNKLRKLNFQCAEFSGQGWTFNGSTLERKNYSASAGAATDGGLVMCPQPYITVSGIRVGYASGSIGGQSYQNPVNLKLQCNGANATGGALQAGNPPVVPPVIKSPIYTDPNKRYVDPNTPSFMVILKGPVPNATKYKATWRKGPFALSRFSSGVPAYISSGYAVAFGPLPPTMRSGTIRYTVQGCNNDNQCGRVAIADFVAGSPPPQGTAPSQSLSFGTHIYPLITATSARADLGQQTACIGCHSSNGMYPQKLQTNAGQCGVTSAPSIQFTSMMNATTMLSRLKCLRASSQSGTYAAALNKVYVVPGDYQNSGLYHKAKNSNAFSTQIRQLIQDWIAQGARP
jgi:hypothetical protein